MSESTGVPRARGVVLRRNLGPVHLVAPSCVAAGVALLPLAYLVVRASERGWGPVRAELARSQTADLFIRSISLAAVVTVAASLLGVGLAWLVSATDLPGKRALEVVLALPLAIPTYVAAYTWVASFRGFEGFWASALVLTACCYPYVVLPVLAAWRRHDPALAEVARSLGCSPLQAFVRGTLPQLRPAAASGALLVALYVLSDFGAVSLLRYETFTQAIYVAYAVSFDRTPAAVLGCLLVVLTVLLVVGERRARGAADRSVVSARGARRSAAPVALGRLRTPLLLGISVVPAVAVGVPMWSLVRWGLERGAATVGLGELWTVVTNTAFASAAGALACLALALPVGVLAARHRTRSARLLEMSTWIGHALPGTVVALSLVFFGIRFAPSLYQRLPLLVVAYVVLFLPSAVGAVRASVAQSSPRLEEVARSSGAGPFAVLRRVSVPLAAPGITAGGALVALTCLKELPATLLLRPTGFETLATRLWTETSVADYGRAAPFAGVIVVLGLVPTALVVRAGRS